MNPFRKKSDREFVDALRRALRVERRIALACALVGIAFLVFAAWAVIWTERHVLKLLEINRAVFETDHTARAEAAAQLAGLVAYATGLRIGALTTQAAFFGVLLIVGGLRFRFGRRKDRLLIHYFDLAVHERKPAAE